MLDLPCRMEQVAFFDQKADESALRLPSEVVRAQAAEAGV